MSSHTLADNINICSGWVPREGGPHSDRLQLQATAVKPNVKRSTTMVLYQGRGKPAGMLMAERLTLRDPRLPRTRTQRGTQGKGRSRR